MTKQVIIEMIQRAGFDPVERDTVYNRVAAAECFIIQNGYTDLPPATDKSKIVPENVDPMTDEFGMSLRHDSLERRATSVVQDEEFWGGSWMVMFRMKGQDVENYYGQEMLKTWGRAIVMDFYGKNIRIQHSPYPLMRPGARIIAP